MKTVSTKEEPLCGRKSYVFNLEAKQSPKRAELQQKVAKSLDADEKLVVINHIHSTYGTDLFVIEAQVYDSEATYKKFVPEALAKKSVIKKEEPKAEASE